MEVSCHLDVLCQSRLISIPSDLPEVLSWILSDFVRTRMETPEVVVRKMVARRCITHVYATLNEETLEAFDTSLH